VARIRLLKPGFFHNEILSELEPHARLLFAGLWLLADRDGRLEDRPKRVAIEIFPYEPHLNVDGLLSQLDDAGFIVRYEVDGVCIIQIVTFVRHQSPHQKEAPSQLAKIPSDFVKPSNFRTKPSQAPVKTEFGPADPDPDPDLSPYPDPTLHHSRARMEREREDGFEAFWFTYPRKVGKGEARKVWKKLRPSAALTDQIVEAVRRQRVWPDWTKDGGKFIPHPATWLNQTRWEDEGVDATPRSNRTWSNDCPHQPPCADGRWRCIQRQQMAQLKELEP
jgi:hypothetical protein